MTPITYARGWGNQDAYPRPMTAPSFAAFIAALDRDRAPVMRGDPETYSAPYIAAPFNGNGRRCAEGALPRRWIALDLDRIAPDVLPDVRLWLARFSGCAWPTRRSTPEAPRERVILELDREATRAECIAIGAALAADLGEEFGEAIYCDKSAAQPEQAQYLPPRGVTLARFTGEPLNVDAYLAAAQNRAQDAPERPKERTAGSADVLDAIDRGEGLHDAILRLVAHMAAHGLDRPTIEAAALGLLERSRRVRPDRVDELAGDELRRMIAGAMAKYAPGDVTRDAEEWELPRLLDVRSLAGEPPPPQFIVPDWLPAGEVALFAGHGGTGKSAIALYLAACIALGRPFFGLQCERRRVLLLSLEDTAPVLHWRLARLAAWMGFEVAELSGWLTIADGTGADAELLTETKHGAVLTYVYEWLRQRMADAEVLIVDGASDAFGASEINRRHVRQFVRALRRLIPPNGAAVILAHVDKATAKSADTSQGYSGSTAWSNSVRARWYLRPDDAGDGLLLELQKANLAPAGATIAVRWNEAAHVFVGECVLPATRLARDLAEITERDAIVAAMRACAAGGTSVPAATMGPRTAVHVLSARPEFPESLRAGKAARGRFWRHLEHLRAMGTVCEVSIRRADRHYVRVLTLASEGCGAAGNGA